MEYRRSAWTMVAYLASFRPKSRSGLVILTTLAWIISVVICQYVLSPRPRRYTPITPTFRTGRQVLLHDRPRNVTSASVTISKGDHATWQGLEEEEVKPRFAYAQYATDLDYFCNAMINTRRLLAYGAQHDIVLMYPDSWDHHSNFTDQRTALEHARRTFPTLKLAPMPLLTTDQGDSTWAESLTKFNVFRLINYTRVIYFDSDSLVLNSMDHYFLSPDAPIAVPRAYWLNDLDNPDINSFARQTVGSHFMMVKPNIRTYNAIHAEATRSGSFDMEIVNRLFGGSAMILPHRYLAILSGEFRNREHSKYLSADKADRPEDWNALTEILNSKLVHFSDWPLPKPWLPREEEQMEELMPTCDPTHGADRAIEGRPECADRLVWLSLYEEYDEERSEVCDGLFGQTYLEAL